MDFGILEFGLDFGNLDFLESEKEFASWIDISILDPARIYLYKKKVTQKFSLLSLHKIKKEYHSFLPLRSEMVFPRDARSKKRSWIDISILDPARVYL